MNKFMRDYGKQILAVASATDLDFRYGCTPAWWQIWKGLYEVGTDLIVTHQGAFFEGSDGAQMREQGWRKLLDKLTKELA